MDGERLGSVVRRLEPGTAGLQGEDERTRGELLAIGRLDRQHLSGGRCAQRQRLQCHPKLAART